MTRFTPDGDTTVEWLFLDGDTADVRLARWLDGALPHAAWNCHVVAAGGDPRGRLLDAIVTHLEREPVALVHFHLATAAGLGESAPLDRLFDAAAGFQNQAYRERTGARLVPLPILEVPPAEPPRAALETAAAAAARLARPSLLLWDEPDQDTVAAAATLGIRLYLGSRSGADTAMDVLTSAHVLDSTLERLEGQDPILGPCRPHEVVGGDRLFVCARQWRRRLSHASIDDAAAPEWRPDDALCAGCIADTVAAMGPSMTVNQRRDEGRELALRTSAALADSGSFDAAGEVAATAVTLSDNDLDRADALVQTALCRVAGGRFAAADRSLLAAAGCGASPGLIALHRARVQVAWRDDIEALDRFAEALELGTDAVSDSDLHFEMALCHIRLEEWADARRHLEGAGGPAAAIAFNLGVCDANTGEPERALVHFDHALELGPPAEDIGRVRFFRGFCLKQLERYDEAVDDLRRSIELEEAELAHHNLLGFCLFKLGRHTEAVASFEAAVATDPSSAIDWANIGVNLERLGNLRRAAEMYRKALGMDPSIDFARAGLERVGR